MGEEYFGGCRCAKIRYACREAPLIQLICHCRDCQLASGSAYSAGLIVPTDRLRFIHSEPKFFATTAASGRTMRRGFCDECGSPISIRRPETPLIEFLHAATLDDPSRFSPTYEVWVSSAQPWHHLHPDTLKYPKAPPPELLRPQISAYFSVRS